MSAKAPTVAPAMTKGYGFANAQDRLFPNMVHLDLINVCNMRCLHCPQSNIKAHVPDYRPNQLDFDLFQKIVDEVAEHGATLRITCDGEPFLYKHIVEAIEYVKQARVALVTITTNGSILTDRIAEAILRPSETQLLIDFSLDSLFPSTYRRIRARGNFVAVYNNVFYVLKNKKRNPNLRVVVNIIDQDALADGELDAFRRFWAPLADDVVIRTYATVKGMIANSSLKIDAGQCRWPCSLLWNRIAISSHGRPRFCVADWREESAFKWFDLRSHTIKELWQSEEYDRLRQLHLERSFSSIGICEHCTDWFGLKWNYDYKRVIQRLFADGERQKRGEHLVCGQVE